MAIVSLVGAIVTARLGIPGGPWLWNLDLPKIDYPLASFFHDALAAGRLPLWNDQLGLGYPLYAEGQIGAFYPPNWLIFQLPPLVALDLSRVLHLTLAGLGTGLIALRLSGSRTGAVAAALVAVCGGAIATKLEWHNLVAAYGWLPWVLLPLVRRPRPTRSGLVVAGILWGIQALAGHPNIWLLTGLTAVVVLIATTPRVATIGRVLAFGFIGVAVGAVQLIPTAILTTLSVRSAALSRIDLFTSAATPFDVLGFAFANPFVQTGTDGAWDPASIWYPDGVFALLEAGAFVGLPVIAFAAVGLAPRRIRPILVAIAVLLAIPIVAAFQPDPWRVIPILDGLRSPVRSYVVVALLGGVLAGVGIGRLGRLAVDPPRGGPWARLGAPASAARRSAIALTLVIAAYGLTVVLATSAPGLFDDLLLASSSFLGVADVEGRRRLAVEALGATFPFVAEIALGIAALVVVATAGDRPRARRRVHLVALALVAVPLVLFGHAPNPVRPATDASFAQTPFVMTAAGTGARRLLTLDPPGWYSGMPDQLAAAGVNDVRMFSSLDLRATDDLVDRLSRADPDGLMRRAIGVDTVVTFGTPCPGERTAEVVAENAEFCRPGGTLSPPYWIPADAVTTGVTAAGPFGPIEASVDLATALTDPRPAVVSRRETTSLVATVDAPSDGWLWVDRAWYPTWRTTVDGRDVAVARAMAGRLIPVRAGRHEIHEDFLPWDA
ncbi:MAG TPA: hypothetical protein VLR93_08875, partial [Patescibacteria group bacterium]|nr:hypothetical protein [Patescibacteria group bacterium]